MSVLEQRGRAAEGWGEDRCERGTVGVGTFHKRCTCKGSETRQRNDEGKECTASATKKRPAKVERDGITPRYRCL